MSDENKQGFLFPAEDDREECDKVREACGIVGVFGNPEASTMAYLGLYALQHRGQESCGIVTMNESGRSREIKAMGLVSEVFDEKKLAYLEGNMAIGHVRYSTTGSSMIENAQPIKVDYINGPLAVAHNGNLVNADEIKSELEQAGSIFESTADSETLVHLIAKNNKLEFVESVKRSLQALRGAFSFVVLNKDCLIAARDPNGFRPLEIGKTAAGAYIVASETCAFDLLDAEWTATVEPGEMVVFSKDGIRSLRYTERQRSAMCVFEFIYFARPDSMIFNRSVNDIRRNLGKQLAIEYPVEADVVIPVPDSGVSASIGFAEQAGIKYDMGLIRNHYVGRTFIEPSQNIRDFGVKLKLNPVREILKDKRVVVIDDSIVRGTTSRKIIKMIRAAGAKEVHFRISSPPVLNPCFYGMDFPTKTELIANSHSLEEIRKYLRVDSLAYLSMEGLIKAVGGKKEKFCMACFDGDYPVSFNEGQTKLQFEKGC
ncbi:MAG TPA: amidophosphoribosyltransferase [Candidatus Goldiibacteriota bacterium]|nr:amidophosphoribosyltransferase [Candidatus Goldiibacteriota bacterium]